MGVIDEAIAAGNPRTSLTITFTNKKVRLDVADQLTGPQNYTAYPALRTLSQHDTERMLTELLSQAGRRDRAGRALTDLTQDGDAVTVSLRGEDGSIETARCRWVIGCDGAHSAVRKAAGIPFTGSTYRDEFIMADAELDWELPHGGLYGFPSPAGIFAAFSMPARTGTASSATSRPVPRVRAPSTASPPRRVPGACSTSDAVPRHSRQGVLGDALPRAQPQRAPLPRRASFPRRRRRPRAQPRGRTGHEHRHQDAYNLAWKLALVERGIADESLLDSYQAERHPVGVQLLKTTDRLFSALGGQNPLSRLARGRVAPLVATRVLTRRWHPPVVRRHCWRSCALHYPDSPLNAEDGSGWRDAPAPGDRAREADVFIDGRQGRLHEVFRGTHHTVLLFTGLDDAARPAVELCRIAEQIEQIVSRAGEGARGHRRALRRSPCGPRRSDAVRTPPVRDQVRLRVSSSGRTPTSATVAGRSTPIG